MTAAGDPSPAIAPRALVWRGLDQTSLEHLRLAQGPYGPELTGRIITVEDGEPLSVDYRLRCCRDWRTRELELTQTFEGTSRRFEMARVEAEWWVGGRDRPDLGRCTDIDLALSPSTNALPINRLKLAVGEAADVVAAWVRFPSLTVEVAPQRYERLAERRWRFTSLEDGFTAVLEVDADGLAVEYVGGWTRVAEYRGG